MLHIFTSSFTIWYIKPSGKSVNFAYRTRCLGEIVSFLLPCLAIIHLCYVRAFLPCRKEFSYTNLEKLFTFSFIFTPLHLRPGSHSESPYFPYNDWGLFSSLFAFPVWLRVTVTSIAIMSQAGGLCQKWAIGHRECGGDDMELIYRVLFSYFYSSSLWISIFGASGGFSMFSHPNAPGLCHREGGICMALSYVFRQEPSYRSRAGRRELGSRGMPLHQALGKEIRLRGLTRQIIMKWYCDGKLFVCLFPSYTNTTRSSHLGCCYYMVTRLLN